MPFSPTPEYRCPLFMRGPHRETILPNLSRRRFSVNYVRKRLTLADGDFLDLDCRQIGKEKSDTCLLTLHGLEGSSSAPYIKSMELATRACGWDFVAMNFRGCSGEINRALRFYHSGETEDLQEVLTYLGDRYSKILLVGYSLGGNVVLKHVGESPDRVSHRVKAVAAISAPIDLEGSALKIGEASNAFYMRRFIRLLSYKVEMKQSLYPEEFDAEACRKMRSFEEFDGTVTAPLAGFGSAQEYWRKCSALNWLGDINCPALLLNARNDPFLSPACFPEGLESSSDFVYPCFPARGGHLGFPGNRKAGAAWHERVAIEFFQRFA